MVDDDEAVRRLLFWLFADEGYSVLAAPDEAAALARVREAAPSLILLDMRLPVLDGWEFARRYRAGYAPTTTDSALGAVALAKRLRPVVLVLDLWLPYRSGGALLDDLRADPATAALPVVVVSAFAEALAPARRARVAGVLDKPFSPAVLVAAVRAAAGPASGGRGRAPRRREPR